MMSEEESSKFLNELCSLLFTALRLPHSAISYTAPSVPAQRRKLPPLSPGRVAALMMGLSLSLMVSGSITFLIGFMMMPWVLGLVMLLYFVGILSSVSLLWKAVLDLASSSPPSRSPQKGISVSSL